MRLGSSCKTCRKSAMAAVNLACDLRRRASKNSLSANDGSLASSNSRAASTCPKLSNREISLSRSFSANPSDAVENPTIRPKISPKRCQTRNKKINLPFASAKQKSISTQNRGPFAIMTDLKRAFYDRRPKSLTCSKKTQLPVICIKMTAAKKTQIKTDKPTPTLC